MRLLTTLTGQEKAEAFVAYLLTQQISTHVEPSAAPGEWDIWIRDEDRLREARQELTDYLLYPNDPKYSDAIRDAQRILKERRQQQAERQKQIKSGRNVFQSTSNRVPPITLTLLILATLVSLITNFMKPGPENSFGTTMLEQLRFVSRSDYMASVLSSGNADGVGDPAASLKKGEFWRAITPIFAHGFPFHLIFNAIALLQLGRIVEPMEGSFRYLCLVLVSAIFSNMLQGLVPESFYGYPFFGGLSGVVYAVFGFLWIKTTLRPDVGIMLSPTTVAIMLGWMVLGFLWKDSHMANLAHLGGLLAGGAFGWFAANDKGFRFGKK